MVPPESPPPLIGQAASVKIITSKVDVVCSYRYSIIIIRHIKCGYNNTNLSNVVFVHSSEVVIAQQMQSDPDPNVSFDY
jgi:hypothetical protein